MKNNYKSIFDNVAEDIWLQDSMAAAIISDIVNSTETWEEETTEFLELFATAIETKEGRKLVCFLLGLAEADLFDYLKQMAIELRTENNLIDSSIEDLEDLEDESDE